jgi:pteridine reductase
MLQLNLTSSVVLAHAATPFLRECCGNIVFITCASVEAPYRFHLPYVVSKAGLFQAMRALALELAPAIRVNAVAPGTVLPPVDFDTNTLERLRCAIPLGRFGKVEDIAQAVRFLAEADFVTGQQLVVDGGRSISLAAADG